MTYKEKKHLIHIAYNNIEKVKNDTDKDSWACDHLEEALAALCNWFEEWEI